MPSDSMEVEVQETPAELAGPALANPVGMFQNAASFGINGGQFISAHGGVHFHPPPPTPSSTTRAPQPAHDEIYSENEVYWSQLCRRQRGFPLYVPEPQPDLPPEYLAHGVSIGDVGMVTAEGIWDFFFNIFLPAGHPINEGRVPQGFSPLERYDSSNIRLNFEPGSSISSPSAESCNINFQNFPGGEYLFRCSAPKGAILCLPYGSSLQKITKRRDHVRNYAVQNAKDWYKYINGELGRGMVNGELYLITGREQAIAGGIATFQNVADGSGFDLAFKTVPDQNMNLRYRFNRGTTAQTKSFPFSEPGQDNPHTSNNTIFLHGFTISIGLGIWSTLFGSVGIYSIEDAPPGRAPNGATPFGSQSSGLSYFFGFFSGGNPGNTGKKYVGPHGEEVTISDLVAPPRIVHPSRTMNEYILRTVPDITVVITHDDDWGDIVSDPMVDISNPEHLGARILQQCEIRVEDGIAYPVAPSSQELPTTFPSGLEDGALLTARVDDAMATNFSSEVQQEQPSPPSQTRPGSLHRRFWDLSDRDELDEMDLTVGDSDTVAVNSSPSEPHELPAPLNLSRRQACTRCKNLRVKCDYKNDVDPCKRCFNGGHQCIIPGSKKRRTLPKREHLLNRIREQNNEIQKLMAQLEERRVRVALSAEDPGALPHILTRGIISLSEAEKLFDIYFRQINISVSLLDPVLYTVRETRERSPFLFTVVCGIASRFYSNRPELYPRIMHFAQLAAGTTLINGSKSIESVQGYILMSLYSNRWEDQRGWLYLEMAIRLAIDLNLRLPHTGELSSEASAREALNRTRVWLTCFNLDRATSPSQPGKPLAIRNTDYMANHSENWWLSSPYNMPDLDIHICARTAEVKVISAFMEQVYSASNLPTGVNSLVDYIHVASETDEQLKQLSTGWLNAIYKVIDLNTENMFRLSLLRLSYAYSRLVALSFGFATASEKQGTRQEMYLARCWSAASDALDALTEIVGQEHQRRFLLYGPFAQSVLVTSNISLVVKFLHWEKDPGQHTEEIRNLLKNVITNILTSSELSFEDKHGPNLYTRSLPALLGQLEPVPLEATPSDRVSPDNTHSLSPPPSLTYSASRSPSFRVPSSPPHHAASLSFDKFTPLHPVDPFASVHESIPSEKHDVAPWDWRPAKEPEQHQDGSEP